MGTQEEAAEKLNQIADQLAKVQAEVQALKDQAGQEPVISQALQAAIDRVAAAAQTVDDINPDAPVEPPADQPSEPAA